MPGRIEIDDVQPVVSGGKFPAKAVVGEVAFELAFENSAGGLGAEFGEGPHLHDELFPGPKPSLDGGVFASFEHRLESAFRRFDEFGVEFAPLEQFEMLPAHG